MLSGYVSPQKHVIMELQSELSSGTLRLPTMNPHQEKCNSAQIGFSLRHSLIISSLPFEYIIILGCAQEFT